jgi:hypothetical protein
MDNPLPSTAQIEAHAGFCGELICLHPAFIFFKQKHHIEF